MLSSLKCIKMAVFFRTLALDINDRNIRTVIEKKEKLLLRYFTTIKEESTRILQLLMLKLLSA